MSDRSLFGDRVGAAGAAPASTARRSRQRSRARAMDPDHPLADPALLDLIPCRYRLSKARRDTPVPRGAPAPNPNTDHVIWCECMAQTLAQRHRALYGAPDDPWPAIRGPRPCDALGVVSVHDGPGAARRLYEDHVRARQERIQSRGA